MYILGISCFYHDSAAALLKDGELIAAAMEERFTRKKNDNGFPKLAIEFCLKQAGITGKRQSRGIGKRRLRNGGAIKRNQYGRLLHDRPLSRRHQAKIRPLLPVVSASGQRPSVR